MNELVELYKGIYGFNPYTTTPLPGAGSNRAYYRLGNAEGESVIGVIGTSVEENDAFIYLTNHFISNQLPVPTVLAVSRDRRCYLQTDLGDISLFDMVKQQDLSLVRKTIEFLPLFQIRGNEGLDYSVCYPQPEFDRENIMFDLNYFKYCFLKETGVDFHELRLQRDFETLAVMLLEDKDCYGFMYRDFQSRNVMIRNNQPFFIDYQGGRRGPLYYDLASFVWQASANYSDELKDELVSLYYNRLCEMRQMPQREEFNQRLEIFLFFRLLQVLGAYGYRGNFERKQHFINSIPPALFNLSKVLANLTENQTSALPTLIPLLQTLVASTKETRAFLVSSLTKREKASLSIRVFSFSYKQGIPADTSGNGGGYVFDCRSTHNPGRYEEYKKLTGLDAPVINFLEDDGEILTFLESVYQLADHHVERYLERGFTDLMFSFGCTGGQHRSVYCAQHLAEHLHTKYHITVYLNHIAQHITSTLQ